MQLLATLQRTLRALELDVDPPAGENLVWLLEEMLRWNRTHNLTAITDPVEGVEKHLVDSLTLLPLVGERTDLLDVGSGAGFPGLPLAIVRPGLSVVSVDAVSKKIGFQRHVARRLKLRRFQPWHGRVEELPGLDVAAAGFDVVTARAFSSLPLLIERAAPLLRPQGRVIAMKGPEGANELRQAEPSLNQAGLRCHDLVELRLPLSRAVRQILVLGR